MSFSMCITCIMIIFVDEHEGLVNKLRSILAQLEYSYEIKQWDQKGVTFSMYFYVPEVHPETGQHFLEREDEAHVFKVIGKYTLCMCTYHYYFFFYPRELLLAHEMVVQKNCA